MFSNVLAIDEDSEHPQQSLHIHGSGQICICRRSGLELTRAQSRLGPPSYGTPPALPLGRSIGAMALVTHLRALDLWE